VGDVDRDEEAAAETEALTEGEALMDAEMDGLPWAAELLGDGAAGDTEIDAEVDGLAPMDRLAVGLELGVLLGDPEGLTVGVMEVDGEIVGVMEVDGEIVGVTEAADEIVGVGVTEAAEMKKFP
jgi:hypothetical protein